MYRWTCAPPITDRKIPSYTKRPARPGFGIEKVGAVPANEENAMLDQLQPDLRELIDLVRQAENYDATLAAAQLAGQPIDLGAGAAEERRRKALRIDQLRSKWNI